MGFGRIGRNLFRILYQSEDIKLAAISDIADHKALEYLLRFDTILGPFPDEVSVEEGNLYVIGRQIPMLSEKEPGDVPWGDLGVDTVIEATAQHRTREDFEKHLKQGAKRVILCVPQKTPPDITVVMGVNDDQLKPEHRIVSNGSCTAHCAAPVAKILNEAFGIQRAFLSTVHAYTNQQRLADVPSEDKRRGRAAAENIIPQETNAAQVVTELIPDLAGRLSGASMNVPVPNGSVVDLVCWHEKPVTELAITMVQKENVSKTLSWYDNGWGYAHRVVDLIKKFMEIDKEAA
jgi:glyceraldehyde 3-phosphate dehydrogenase